MTRRIFHKLVSIEEALNIISSRIQLKPLGYEVINLANAYGRILAEDITANIDLPSFDRSIMDGYAVIAEDTFEADESSPVKLKVIGRIEPGEEPKMRVKHGSAIEISTGAAIPPGANAVVMVEYTRKIKDIVEVFRPVAPGENIAHAGSDLMIGEKILRKGTILTPREIGVLAALGRNKVKVYRKPRVTIISTGRELIEPGNKIEPYRVYDVNTYAISAAVMEAGGEPIILGIVGDNYEEIREKIKLAIQIGDLILISGGTSAGLGDIVYRVMGNISEIIVHGLKVKPGKPTVISTVKGKLIVGLPGWPVSALTIFNLLVKPIIQTLSGKRIEEDQYREVRVASRIIPAKGRMNLIPISIIINEKGEEIAYPLLKHSGAIATLTRADGYIIIPENISLIEVGEKVKAKLFSDKIKPVEMTIIGSHCPALEALIEVMEKKVGQINTRIINVGSLSGILAIKRGEADIAGIHLLDEETMTYNIPYMSRYNLKNAILIRGYIREQGLIVKRKNPKKIENVKDLLREDVTFINRNKGSGTRILLDYELKKLAEKENTSFKELIKRIKGYEIEAKTHSSVAASIALGKADVGIGIKAIAKIYNLDFIPIKEENYDFLIRSKSLKKKHVTTFIKTLKSEEFREKLIEMGMKAPKDIGEIIWKPNSHNNSR